MAIRQETYALARPVPYFLERAVEQTIAAPIRHGVSGALVSPDAGGTLTIESPDGTNLVDAQTITVASSQATYTLTPAVTLALGPGYTVRWSLQFSTVQYPIYRTAAYMAEFIPPNVISVVDVYGGEGIPELRHWIPEQQNASNDNTGWQPQIDSAYFAALRLLLNDGRPPWLIREATGWYDFLLASSLKNCVDAIAAGPNALQWTEKVRELAFRVRAAKGALRFQYSSENVNTRLGGTPITQLAPPNRPVW